MKKFSLCCDVPQLPSLLLSHRARYQIARVGEVGEGAEAKVCGCRRMCLTPRPWDSPPWGSLRGGGLVFTLGGWGLCCREQCHV